MHNTPENTQSDAPKVPSSMLSMEAFQQALTMPWKARLEIIRLLQLPYHALSLMLSGATVASGWKLYGTPILQIHRQSTVTIGRNLNLRSSASSNPLGVDSPVIISTRRASANLRIGDHFGMTGGSIVCENTITIGNRVTVGANTIITDTDFHPLDAKIRSEHPELGQTKPIMIEDDVFIGMRSMILKGVTIGEGAVIGAGSTVTKSIPAGVIVAGNPARIIREL